MFSVFRRLNIPLLVLLNVLVLGCYKYEDRVWRNPDGTTSGGSGAPGSSVDTPDTPGAPGPPSGHSGTPAAPQPPARPVLIDNRIIRFGIDLNKGGSITYLASSKDRQNIVNNYDLGRQIQQSYYSGPKDYTVNGAMIHPNARDLGWNPIQSGDIFGNASKVSEIKADSNRIYVKTSPMHWPLANVPGECFFETWYELDRNVVKVRCRLTNQRPDKKQYYGQPQELPALYTNGPYYRLVTYTGMRPFTNDGVVRVDGREGNINVYPTENWFASVNENNFGVGIYMPHAQYVTGFVVGPKGVGGETDIQTNYFSPIRYEIMDHNIVYEYSYALVVGTLDEIRQYAYAQPRPARGPNFRFTKDRQGWHYFGFANDTGWPIQGELNVPLDRKDVLMVSPHFFYEARNVPKIYVRMAVKSPATKARLRWQFPGDPEFLPDRLLEFPIVADGTYRTYELDMTQARNWQGVINLLSIEPALGETGGPDRFVKLQSVTMTPP